MPDINRSSEWVTARLEEVGTATNEGAKQLLTASTVNAKTVAGVVPAPYSNNSYATWATDGSGNPSWSSDNVQFSGTLSSSSDFNNLKRTGFYFIGDSTPSHAPISDMAHTIVEVWTKSVNYVNYYIQRVMMDGVTYMRLGSGSVEVTWANWQASSVRVTSESFSSLPIYIKHPLIASNHAVSYYTLSNPSAETSEWSVTSSVGQIAITGSISGSTTITVLLESVADVTATSTSTTA